MRPLKIDDPIHGHKVIKILEQYNRNEFGLFEDPYESQLWPIILIGLMKEQ